MEKINYTVNSENVIIGWRRIPFFESEPYIIIENPEDIQIGFDKVINGKLVKDSKSLENYKKKMEQVLIIESNIRELKRLLAESDYKLYKFMDGALSEEEYAPIRQQRQSYRDSINILEAELSQIK